MIWDELKGKVEEAGNVLTVSMVELRDAIGVSKLGVKVRHDISNQLEGIGIGHIPVELPANQSEQVRLYKRGTPVGDIIGKILVPGAQNDQVLIERLGTEAPDYALIVDKIRELVSE